MKAIDLGELSEYSLKPVVDSLRFADWRYDFEREWLVAEKGGATLAFLDVQEIPRAGGSRFFLQLPKRAKMELKDMRRRYGVGIGCF